jgi:hypothetical protein
VGQDRAIPKSKAMTLVPYSEAEDIGDRFLGLLQKCGIDPPVATPVEDELLSLTALIEIWKDPSRIHSRYDETMRTAAGIHDLAAKVLCAQALPEFPSFIDHLRLIAAGKVYTSVTQNNVSDIRDDVSRKIAELYVGCLAIHCGTDLALDHPTASKGDNPDVMLSYAGRRWALAIKTISSQSGQTIFENIEGACKQINRSNADAGMVVINTKNVLNHTSFLRPPVPFGALDTAVAALTAEVKKVADLAENDRPSSEWDKIFDGSKAVLPVLFMGQTVTKLPVGGLEEVPTALKVMVAHGLGRSCDGEGVELAHCLNHWMQTMVRGNPGPPPR